MRSCHSEAKLHNVVFNHHTPEEEAAEADMRGWLADAKMRWVEGAALLVVLAMCAAVAAILAYLTLLPIFFVVELLNPTSTLEEDLRWLIALLFCVYMPLFAGTVGKNWEFGRRQ